MDKREFIDRLIRAGQASREFAIRQDPSNEDLPRQLRFNLAEYNHSRSTPAPENHIKFLGGRLLRPEQLKQLSPVQAGTLLWVDGNIPAWINVYTQGRGHLYTYIFVLFTAQLVPAEIENLPPDIGAAQGNPLAPFRIRGMWRQQEAAE